MLARDAGGDSGRDCLPPDSSRAGDWAATFLLILLVAYATGRSVVAAAAKPFWFDEICTWAVAHQASVAAVWTDTGRALEPNPPPFYVVEHFFGAILRNEQIAYRMPSILGFACILVCLFLFVRRRAGALLGVACAAVLLLTIAFDRYSIDARPYALETACIAFAMVCYQRAPARRWTIPMGASLALAASLHYYAVFALVAFVVAETALALKARLLRPGVWIALVCGLAPLAIFWPMLSRVRDYFGPHFWANAALRSATDTYGWLFEASLPARAAIAFVLLLAVVAVALLLLARPSLRTRLRGDSRFPEYALSAALLALPLVILAAARITGGGMTARYALPALLGVPPAIAYLAAPLKRAGAVVAAVLVFLAVGSHERQFWASHGGDFGEFVSPAKPLEEMLRQAGHLDLPVVISNGLDYLSIVHYAPEQAARLVALVDPVASIAELGNDSLDKGLLAVRCCMAIQVYDYPAFAKQHPVFLLYSDGDIDFDRWPERLMRKRLGLNLLAVDGPRNLYLVDTNDSGD